MMPPRTTRCPQCNTLYCGDYACRFTGKTHESVFEKERLQAQVEEMIRREKAVPKWLKDSLTGALDPATVDRRRG